MSKPGDIDSTVILEPPVPTNSAICRPTLPSVDITTIRKLSARVNVLPVVACADTLTNERLTIIKSVIKYDLAKAGIGFGIFDTSADPPLAPEFFLDAPGSPPPLLPFALISPDIYSHSDGVNKTPQPLSRLDLLHQYTPVLNNANNARSPPHPASKLVPRKYVRSYRWGSLDVMDRNHCDFVALREAVFFHMEVLIFLFLDTWSKHAVKTRSNILFFFSLCFLSMPLCSCLAFSLRLCKNTQESTCFRDSLQSTYKLSKLQSRRQPQGDLLPLTVLGYQLLHQNRLSL